MRLFDRVPGRVQIVEVGPRDGLQNEAVTLSTADKLRYIELLGEAGLTNIEIAAFVNPKRVPAMADSAEIFAGLNRRPGVRYPALAPNQQGLDRALEAGATEIAFFTAASDSFNQRNINMSVMESLEVIEKLNQTARRHNLWTRAYISTAFHCPYEGPVSRARIIALTRSMFEMGINEVSLGDTIGAATPREVAKLTDELFNWFDPLRLSYHFHDTYGMAAANVLTALQMGIRIFDSSSGGLGGCPFAPGASGNLATEDLVALLEGLGVETGVDLGKVAAASQFIEEKLGRPLPGKRFQAWKAAQSRAANAAE